MPIGEVLAMKLKHGQWCIVLIISKVLIFFKYLNKVSYIIYEEDTEAAF